MSIARDLRDLDRASGPTAATCPETDADRAAARAADEADFEAGAWPYSPHEPAAPSILPPSTKEMS